MAQTLTDLLFAPAGLTAHGFCLLWEPWLIWSHALANLAIGLAYFSIPVALVGFARRRRDLVFRPVFLLFAAFILLCGAGHWVDLLTLWVPAYGLEAAVKVATAVVSVATAAALWPLLPKALALPSPAQMAAANAALAESEARYRAGFLRSPMPLHTLDARGVVTGVSDRWLDLLGYRREEVVGRPLAAFQDAASAAAIPGSWRRLVAEGEVRDLERRFVHRDGSLVDVLVSARAEPAPPGGEEGGLRVLGALVDVTARKRAEAAAREAEERLRQAQKMDALGQLAGGIAHDFNNVLQAVAGGASLIGRRAEDPAAVRRLAAMVTEAAARGGATCRRLLSFARRTDLEAAPVSAAALLGDIREILAHTLGAGIAVRVEADAAAPPLLADRGELETVLVNLATNARDAMPEGGTLTFSAAAEAVEAGGAAPHPAGLAPGAYVRIAVADTGLGMDPATLARAAEPFFTTKPQGKGTGLGLAMARGFAQQSGGGLAIASAPGRGTTVTLWLPVAPAAAAPAAAGAPHAALAARAAAPGAPVVLLVDDEPMVRTVLAQELEDAGYRVVAAEGAAAALAHLDAGGAAALLVTDLSMPAMDGVRLIREAQRRRPGLRAILMTGYAGEAASLAVSGALTGSFSLLRKPVSGQELADRAAALLEAPARA